MKIRLLLLAFLMAYVSGKSAACAHRDYSFERPAAFQRAVKKYREEKVFAELRREHSVPYKYAQKKRKNHNYVQLCQPHVVQGFQDDGEDKALALIKKSLDQCQKNIDQQLYPHIPRSKKLRKSEKILRKQLRSFCELFEFIKVICTQSRDLSFDEETIKALILDIQQQIPLKQAEKINFVARAQAEFKFLSGLSQASDEKKRLLFEMSIFLYLYELVCNYPFKEVKIRQTDRLPKKAVARRAHAHAAADELADYFDDLNIGGKNDDQLSGDEADTEWEEVLKENVVVPQVEDDKVAFSS